jgi:hypothetical protein
MSLVRSVRAIGASRRVVLGNRVMGANFGAAPKADGHGHGHDDHHGDHHEDHVHVVYLNYIL